MSISKTCTKCSSKGYSTCTSFASNLISLYFDYWLAKVTILKDPNNGLLENYFDIINFKRMQKGVIPVILDYFVDDIVIGNIIEKKYDHNGKIIAASCTITKTNFYTITIYAADYSLFEKSIEFEELKKAWGWTNLNQPIFKAIFFLNNIFQSPSLCHLDSIIANIHELDEKNSENHDWINVKTLTKLNKKPTPEQGNNLGLVVSKDGTSAYAIDWNDTNISTYTSKVEVENLSRWSSIKDELLYFKDLFMEFSGMANEKISTDRENIVETWNRISKTSAIEKQYYKQIENFLKDYNKYFNVEVEYIFDTLTENIVKQNPEDIKNNAKNPILEPILENEVMSNE